PVPAVQTLLVHTLPEEQLPQLSVAEQPSLIVPQFLPDAAQVVGVHAAAHWKDALQTFPVVQVPQASVPPQPSLGAPHCTAVPPAPTFWQVLGVQLETQVFEDVHV